MSVSLPHMNRRWRPATGGGAHRGALSGLYHGVKLGSGCSSMHTWPWSTPELRTIVQCQPYQSEGTPLLVDREEDFYPGLVSLRVVMQK